MKKKRSDFILYELKISPVNLANHRSEKKILRRFRRKNDKNNNKILMIRNNPI